MPQPRPPLFREASLARLSTSDRLDRTLAVSSAKGWLALVVLGGMTLAVVAWSLLGQVSTYVSAPGILLPRGGTIVDAVSTASGSLSRLLVGLGDPVEAGSPIAVIVDSEAIELHHSAVAAVAEAARGLEALLAARRVESALRLENVERQRQRHQTLEANARDSLAVASEFLEAHRRFVARGLVARVDLEQRQQAYDAAQRELFAILRERDDLEYDEVRRRNEQAAEIAEKEASLDAARRTVSELEARLATHEVLAPTAGRVAEIKAAAGAVVTPGAPLVSIRPAGELLEALIYVAPDDGKRVDVGMPVLVSPSSARREEYGAIRGRIAEIAAFPATPDGMLAVLQSPALAEFFAADGPPYAGRVALDVDPLSESGLAWTSSRGLGVTVSSGTLLSAEIRLDSRPPIILVAPALRRLLDR